jgi:hypothetical protein
LNSCEVIADGRLEQPEIIALRRVNRRAPIDYSGLQRTCGTFLTNGRTPPAPANLSSKEKSMTSNEKRLGRALFNVSPTRKR